MLVVDAMVQESVVDHLFDLLAAMAIGNAVQSKLASSYAVEFEAQYSPHSPDGRNRYRWQL